MGWLVAILITVGVIGLVLYEHRHGNDFDDEA